MKTSDSIVKLHAALVEAQKEMPSIPMNAKNPYFDRKYADLGAVIQASKPVLTKHGLTIVQEPTTSYSPDGVLNTGIITRLVHVSGEWLETSPCFIPLTTDKGRTTAQGVGMIITYLRRYAWASVLSLYADQDDDGAFTEEEPVKNKNRTVSAMDANVIKTVLEDGIFENIPNATRVLAKFVPKKASIEEFLTKARLYRAWRENGAEVDYAIEKANALEEVE